MRRSNYDKSPHVTVPDGRDACVAGWDKCVERLRRAIRERSARQTILVVECYPGVDETLVQSELERGLQPAFTAEVRKALLPPKHIDSLVAPFLGGDDPVFGFRTALKLPRFFEEDRVHYLRSKITETEEGLILVVGCGASMIIGGDILVYADLARWEAQSRFRHGTASNLGVENRDAPSSLQYKRAFFVDWPVADDWKRPLIGKWDFVLDTNDPASPKLAEGDAVRRGLRHVVTRPFRLVPFFDPAPWGGQWMKGVCALGDAPNYGWGFDCVPEENSLVLGFGEIRFEMPAQNLVYDQPRALLGEEVYARFGAEFPIRFDFLDTIGGGNLSLQVHPFVDYIQRYFGMPYTQDESYYMLDAGTDAHVFLGLKEGIDPEAMTQALRQAQAGGPPFPAEEFVNRWPAKKHDHFLIPAGTVHCAGAGTMTLEISATPYIFTFKMWDWKRLGLDGKPRPIHLGHGLANVAWDRTTEWTRRNLINRFHPSCSGDGWSETCTGLDERQFIETRRHWFTKTVPHHTGGGVNVLNLIEGNAAIVESPDHSFEPFTIHYAETFVIPAQVGPYQIRPLGEEPHATIKAFVRPGLSDLFKPPAP